MKSIKYYKSSFQTNDNQFTRIYHYCIREPNTWYMEQNKTHEEENKYYASEDYERHLAYLIETWVTAIKQEFNNVTDFTDISKLFYDGYYWPEFNSEWVDDIFERNILDTNVCLK